MAKSVPAAPTRRNRRPRQRRGGQGEPPAPNPVHPVHETRPGPSPLRTPEQAIAALRQTGGRVTEAARALGLGRRTFYDLMARHPEVAEVVEEERELLLDKSEGVVAGAVRAKDFRAAVFVLRTQGRKRGWVERQELAGVNGSPLGFQLVLLDGRGPLSNDPFADLTPATPALPPPGASWPPHPGQARLDAPGGSG